MQLAVDDFGTGYSSLNYIRRFPVDILKVDKSFVDGVNDGGEASALTAAVIELAGILNLRPVAEGIERADQLEQLLELRCDLGQGFFFAKPLPLARVHELLTTRQTLGSGRPRSPPRIAVRPCGRTGTHARCVDSVATCRVTRTPIGTTAAGAARRVGSGSTGPRGTAPSVASRSRRARS